MEVAGADAYLRGNQRRGHVGLTQRVVQSEGRVQNPPAGGILDHREQNIQIIHLFHFQDVNYLLLT